MNCDVTTIEAHVKKAGITHTGTLGSPASAGGGPRLGGVGPFRAQHRSFSECICWGLLYILPCVWTMTAVMMTRWVMVSVCDESWVMFDDSCRRFCGAGYSDSQWTFSVMCSCTCSPICPCCTTAVHGISSYLVSHDIFELRVVADCHLLLWFSTCQVIRMEDWSYRSSF